MITTYHTYPDLVTLTSERLAATEFAQQTNPNSVIDYVISNDNESIILRVSQGHTMYRGLMPGGIG
jgi:hypothetical protein